MARFRANETITAAATKPMLAITGDGNVDLEVLLIRIFSPAAPDDYNFLFSLAEISTAGTTPTALSNAIAGVGPGGTSVATGGKATWAADPTVAIPGILGLGLNRRGAANFQSVFGEGLRTKVRANNRGFEIYCNTAGSSTDFNHCLHWNE